MSLPHFPRVYLGILCVAMAATSCDRRAKPVSQTRPAARPSLLSQNAPADRAADDAGRFLAGIPGTPGSPFLPLEQTPEWSRHSRELNQDWASIEAQAIVAMKRFRSAALQRDGIGDTTVFYPFSGPDALMVSVFFPDCPTYILVGLEPPGTLPSPSAIESKNLEFYLSEVRETIFSELHRSFFITREMDHQFRGQVSDGLLPTILNLLVRSGHSIAGYRSVSVGLDGTLAGRTPGDSLPHGVQVDFRRESAPVQRLYYFSVNLADSRLGKNKAFLNFLSRLSGVTTYMKATSYMPHHRDFQLIGRLVLNRSAAILQDDSGIPYRDFDARWHVQLFGSYDHPYGSFKWLKQADLKRAYQTQNPIPLGFRIGYGYSKVPSNLMLAVRKQR